MDKQQPMTREQRAELRARIGLFYKGVRHGRRMAALGLPWPRR